MINIKVALILTFFSYFLDLKRKMEKNAMIINEINTLSSFNPSYSAEKTTSRIIVITMSTFWILFKSVRTLQNFLQIHIQLFHHRFIVSINKFTSLSQIFNEVPTPIGLNRRGWVTIYKRNTHSEIFF